MAEFRVTFMETTSSQKKTVVTVSADDENAAVSVAVKKGWGQRATFAGNFGLSQSANGTYGQVVKRVGRSETWNCLTPTVRVDVELVPVVSDPLLDLLNDK
jgi:hypothetical protein